MTLFFTLSPDRPGWLGVAFFAFEGLAHVGNEKNYYAQTRGSQRELAGD
jgi:hypothetical protein